MDRGSTDRVRLSVIVATRDRPSFLEHCLEALQGSVGPDDEIIVVDSCSTGKATGEIAKEHDVSLLRCNTPGASRARNTGWRAARGSLVAFIDDDVRVDRYWADALHAASILHPATSFFTGRLGLLPAEAGWERPVSYFERNEPFVIDPGVVSDFGHGANLAVRKSALEVIRGYDELLGPGARWHAAEDLDLVDRLLSEGYLGRYEPSIAAFHQQWRRRPELLRLEWRYGIGHGARLARLRTRDPIRYKAVRQVVWKRDGLIALGHCVRTRYKFEVVSTVLRLTATALGEMTASFVQRRKGDGLSMGSRVPSGSAPP